MPLGLGIGFYDLRECTQDLIQLWSREPEGAQLELAGKAGLDAAHAAILEVAVKEVAAFLCGL